MSKTTDQWAKYAISSLITYAILMTIRKDVQFAAIGLGINTLWYVLILALTWNRNRLEVRRINVAQSPETPATRTRMATILTIIDSCPVTGYQHRSYEWAGEKHLPAWVERGDLGYLPWPVEEERLLLWDTTTQNLEDPNLVRVRRTDVAGYQFYRLKKIAYWVLKHYKEFEGRLILTLCVWKLATFVPGERPHWGWVGKDDS